MRPILAHCGFAWSELVLTCRRLRLEPEVMDEDIDRFLGPNLAAFLAAGPS